MSKERQSVSQIIILLAALVGCSSKQAEQSAEKQGVQESKGASRVSDIASQTAPGAASSPKDLSHWQATESSSVIRTRDAARRLLSDEIPFLRRQLSERGEARLWAAWGLGKLCAVDRPAISSALVTALASWSLDVDPPNPLELATLGRAVGSCATGDDEMVLRSWLTTDPARALPGLLEAAALGLGTFADRTGRLDERTVTALLDTAEREKNGRLLYPLGRLPPLNQALSDRVLDVAGELVTGGSADARRFGILALGSAGANATLPLAQLALQKDFAAADRAAAAHALGRLDAAGQVGLDRTLKELLERGLPQRADQEDWLVLYALITLLREPRESAQALSEIGRARLPDPTSGAEAAQRRRLVTLRCRAAELLAKKDHNHKLLTDCDPAHGREEHMARLHVLGRDRLDAARAKAFAGLVATAEPAILQEAVRMLPAHPEYEQTLEVLVRALDSASPGPRTTALQVIAAHPHRAYTKSREAAPDPRVIAAVERILSTQSEAWPETLAAALGAAGALGTLTLKPAVERHCDGKQRSLHPSAQAALSLLGEPKQKCPQAPVASSAAPTSSTTPASSTAPASSSAPAAAMSGAPAAAMSGAPAATMSGALGAAHSGATTTDRTAAFKVRLHSDVGELTLHLDSPHTENSRLRFVELVRKALYEGVEVTAVLSGFAIQWGDRDGDGYDDSPEKMETYELGPTPWTALSVGLTSFAPFAPSSQLLVTLSESPQLTGDKVRLGKAEGPWHLLLPGDRLTSIRVE